MRRCCRRAAALAIFLIWWAFASSVNVMAEGQNDNGLQLQHGDHVIFIGNTFADQLRMYGYVETLLAARFPNLDLTFRNLGWSGDTLTLQPRPLNFGSLDNHLRQQQADVIIACFGMNESFEGPRGVERFRSDWNTLIEHFRGQAYHGDSAPQLVMVSPVAHEQLNNRWGDAESHNRHLQLYTDCMREVAGRHDVLLVDLFTSTRALSRQAAARNLTNNGIHLNQYGYWVASQLIADAIGPAVRPWRIEVDAKALQIEASGTTATSLGMVNDALHFTVTDYYLPVPPAPVNSRVHDSLADKQPRLIVTNLTPGRYELRVNGQTIAQADHRALEKGIVLTASPAHQRSEALRSVVVQKNAQFFFRWRASNSEYIFGRRAKPFGVVSFPPEMEKLDRIVASKDKTTWPLTAPLKDQQWQLVPVSE